MIDNSSDLERSLISLVRKYNVRCRFINIEDDIVRLGIQSSKLNNLTLFNKLKLLKLKPINITYGNWVFRFTTL